MFYIKTDDIDELFREAADKYHIDTAAAQAWDDVQAAVHADDAPPPPPPPENGKSRRWFVLGWLLLVPLGWFAHNAWMTINQPKPKPAAGQFAEENPKKEADKTVFEKTDKEAGDTKKTAVATTAQEIKGSKNEKPPAIGSSLFVKQGTANMRVRQAEIMGSNLNTRPGNTPGPGLLSNGNPADKTVQNAAGFGNSIPGTGAAAKSNGAEAATQHVNNQAVAQQPVAGIVENGGKPAVNTPDVNASAGGNQAETSQNKPGLSAKATKEKSGHYFYVGLSAAPDVSFIHFQKASSVGIGAGIVLGYQFNKKFSLETGALLEKKFYYTSGEYFNISKVPYFVNNNVQPISVTGDCDMVEIPLNLKYTFKAKGNSSFYALGGVSSYLMGRESYTFDYDLWGANAHSTWGYNNPEGYWLSILNLGAGYERKIGAKTNLRIEPYMKLPLSGLGTGSLKIASTGLYLTLTRKIP